MSKEELEEMLRAHSDQQQNIKSQILDKANKEEIEAQLKLVRRREYYYKRVKPGFAPSNQPNYHGEGVREDSLDETSPDSPGFKRKQNHRQLRNLSPKKEWNPLFYCSVEMGRPKKQYVKMSDRVV